MNINQHFSNLAAKAAEEGADASQLISQRERLFKDKVIPELTKRGANDTAIVQAREKWYSQTDKVMQSAGLLPKAGQSSRSFAKDKRADKANQEAVKTGSNFPIIKEALRSTGETIGNVFGQGVGSTIESAAGFVRDIGENEQDSISAKVADYGKNLRKEYENSASSFQKELQAGDHGKAAQLSTGAIQSVPAMAAPFGVAKIVSKGAGALNATKAAAPYLGMGAGVVAGHTQNYGEVRRNATENLERDFPSWEKLQGNPLFEQNFQEKLNSGLGINQARQQAHAATLDTLSEQAANKYGSAMTAMDFIAPSGAVLGSGILKNAPTSKIGKALTGGGVDSALVKREMQQVPRTGMAKLVPDMSIAANKAAAKMVGKQALEEGLQGGIGEYGAQAASANIGGTPVDYGKVGQTILEEGLVGGIMGGGMQSATGGSPTSQAKNVAKQLRNQTNTLRQEEAAARKELADAMQLNDPQQIQSAQANLNNIGAEASKVKAAYDQYGIDTPYFVQRFASQYQPPKQEEQEPAAVEQAVQPEVQPEVQPQPTEQPQATPINQGMANTTNLVMDSVSNGYITPEEAQVIQTDPIRADVFTLTMTGDEAAAHNVVMNAVTQGTIDTDQAQDLIQSITRYSQAKAPKKPSVSSIVNNHVKQQIHPQDRGLFSNPVELDPNTFEPIDPNQPSPFQEDFNEPKEFHNATKANDYVRINGLTDSHDIEIADDGTLVVVKKQGIIPDDPNLSDFDYSPENIVQPTPADPNLSNFSEGPVSVDSLNADNVPDLLDPEEAQQPVQPTPTKQPDHNKPKTFTNYVRANDFVKTNGLKDSHEIINKGEGQVVVQPKSAAPIEDFESDQEFDDLLNAVPPAGTPAQNPVEPVQAEGPVTDFDSDEAFDGLLSAVPPSGKQTDPVQPTASFADQIRDAHLNKPSDKPKLIQDEVAKGRPRAEVLAEVSDVVKAISMTTTPELKADTPELVPEPGAPSQIPIEQKTGENGIQENDAPEGMKSGDIGRGSDGKPFLSKNAANRGLKLRDVEKTHEVVQLAPSQFVLRHKDGAGELNRLQVEAEAPINESKQVTDPLGFPLDKVKEAYGHAHLSPGNTARSFKESFDKFIQAETDDAQALATTEAQKTALDDAINWVKENYINEALPPLLNAASATVSSARAGRNNFNSKQADQRGSALDKATAKFDAELERLKGYTKLKVLAARTPKQKQADAEAEAQAQAEKDAAEQAKVEAQIKADAEAKANKKRASNEWITHPDSAEHMTMEEWKAIGKDYKGITDGVRRHMGVPVWITDEGKSKPKNQSNDVLKVGNTITFSEVFDYALPNEPYTIVTAAKAKITLQSKSGGQFSFNPNILAIEKAKNPDLYKVDSAKIEPEQPAPPAEETQASDYETVRKQFDAVTERLDDGDESLTLDELKAAYKALMDNQDSLVSELSSQTKQQLLDKMHPYYAAMYKSHKKDELVNKWVSNTFRAMDFSSGGVVTISYGDKRTMPEIVRDKIEAATQEDLNKYLEEQRQAKIQREKDLEAAEAGMNDPKTMDDFKRIYANGDFKDFKDFYRSLTIPQQALYDELKSDTYNEQRMQEIERNKAYREASNPSHAVESTTEATLFAGKHTKKGTDIWTVALNGRVDGDAFNDYRSQAKGLGGYYSSYKGGGAVPGFIFDNEATANEFLNLVTGDHEAKSTDPEPEAIAVDPQAEVEVIETDAKRQADKLRERAQAVIDRGEQNINRDRKTNTAKRAGDAARAEERANSAIFLGETLNQIADGIENGSVKYLSRLGAMTQLSHLESLLQRASYDQQRETNAKEREITATTIAYAEFPQYKTWIDSFNNIRSDLKAANPRLAEKLEKTIGIRYHNAYTRWLNETNEFGTENYVGQLARKSDGSPAVFKTNIKQAETLVKASNKRAGKDSFEVFKIKNGEYAVISSYETAMENESWKPTNSDKQMTLTNEFGNELYNALKQYKRKNPSYHMNWLIESMHDSVSRMEKLGIHDPATFRAAMREYLSLRSKEKANDPIKEMERSMIGRSNDGLDFFPTPRNVVEQMIEMADLDSDMKVLEPSAGMGHIADVLKDHGIIPDVIELSGKRQDLLKLKGYSVVGNDFLIFDPKNRAPNYGDVFKTADGKYQGVMRGSGSLGSNRVRLMREDDSQMITYFDRDELELVKMNGVNYDRIIMNPPFSDRRDAAHIYHAFDLLADDGVMVAIAGEGVFFGKDKAAKEFQDWLDQVGAEITPLDAGTFNDPSLPVTTGVKARIIKINKADSSGKRFSRSEDLNQLPAHVKENTNGSTPDQVRTELVNRFGEDTIQQLEQKGILSIVPTHTEQGVEGFAENGRVTLIADAITAENIVPVFLHELGGHIGMQGVLKASAYDHLMSEFNRLVKSGNPDAIEAKRLAERESDAQVQADEYLPYLITVAARNQQNQGPAQKLINRVLSAVKAWAVDRLGLNLKLNPSDMVALAERMIKTISKGTPPTPPKGERRYSRSSTANPQNMSRTKQREFLDKAAATAFGQMSLRGAEASKTLSNRTLNLFQTMLHKALRDETGEFKKTFDLVQGKINHVTFASSKSMDVAPNVLIQLEEGSDYWKEVKRVGRTMGNTLSGGRIDKAKVDKDLKKIGDLMFENTLLDNSERHTVKELKQLGFDDEQISLYNEVREAIDTSLDTFANTTFSNIYKHLGGTTEEVLELAGKDLDIVDHYNEILKRIDALTKGKPEKADARQAAIEAIDRVFKKANDLKDQGYVPLMRFGKYFVRIYNPTTGEVAYRQHFESESERNLFYRNYDKANIPAGYEIEQGQINELQHKLFQGVSPETVALFAKESGLPIGDAETAYIKYAVQNNHALKRLLKRQGIDGFDSDLKRVLASFVMSNARYSANQTYNPAIDESIADINDPAYQEDAIRLRDYSLDTQEELAAVKNFAFVWYMGFSAMFGLVNLTQPLLQTFPYLMQYSKDHGTILKAFGKAVTTWRKGTNVMDQKYKAHYERARKEGHLDPQNTWMMQGLERGKSGLGASTWQLVSHASGLFAQASETVNRRTSLFAALDVAESMGQAKLEKLGFKDAYDFAVRTIQETQGIYNKGNRPRLSRGNIGSMLMMYKQFMIAYIEQMVRMQKSGLYGGDDDEFKKKMAGLVGFGISRSVLTMLGILMAFSGTSGLPFVRDILDGIETAGGLIGKPVNTEREIQIALHNALGHTMGSAANTALMDGFINLNPLIDVKGRMGMGDLIPATAYFSPTTSDYMKSSEISQIAGPIGGLLEKLKESVALAQVGAYGQSGVQLLPKAITSVGQGAIAATTGDYRNMKTGVKTNDATVLDGIVKMLDAQPAGIAKEGRVRGLEMKDKSSQTYLNKRWKERYEAALETGDRANVRAVKKEIIEYNKENPRYPIKFNQKLAETNFNKSNQTWQEKRKTVKGLEWMSEYNPYLDQ